MFVSHILLIPLLVAIFHSDDHTVCPVASGGRYLFVHFVDILTLQEYDQSWKTVVFIFSRLCLYS